ncbi:unnamed protein product [Cuscuta epithymum]|uniref:Uncharacterized protein n=1 Tax=Cuscuta epithymum TaxID=186058 RepID=A0AAV0C1I0_9ASTE|nr:unnamed protein product [Cuscuta epithymum]
MLLWGIWKRQNSLVWNDEWQQPAGLINCCASVLRAWREAQQSPAGSYERQCKLGRRRLDEAEDG